MSYDADVVAATSGRGEDADWDKTIKLCDRIRESFGSSAMSAALGAVMRRVKHTDPLIQMQALTLLEACVSNCGKDFQQELSRSPFHSQAREIITSRTIDQRSIHRFKTLLATWAVDYRNDPQMSGFTSFIGQLTREGLLVIQGSNGGGPSQQTFGSPSVYSSVSPSQRSQEDDDLQKAIRLSLEEAQSQTAPSMYPTFADSPPKQSPPTLSKFNVRAIYDFEAVEDNELTFKAGEVITVLDNSDENWWRGQTQLGSGLFPANFVSPDLKASPEPVRADQKTTSTNNMAADEKTKVTEVNEVQVDLLLDMLKTADITSNNEEELKTLNGLEAECKLMKPLAESNIEKYQKQLDDMNEVSQKLQQALSMYRALLQEKPRLSQKAPPPIIEGTHPPPYQYNNGEVTDSYYVPPHPDVTGTYHGTFTQSVSSYNPPYAPPLAQGAPPNSYVPPTQGAPPNSYAPPTQGASSLAYVPPTQKVMPTSFVSPSQGAPPSSYVPPTQGAPPSSYVPPTQGAPPSSYAPPTQGAPLNSYAPPTFGAPPNSYVPPTQGAPPMSYAPPTHGIQSTYSGTLPEAPPLSLMQNTSHLGPPPSIAMETSNGSTQMIHRQLTPPTNNSQWMNAAAVSNGSSAGGMPYHQQHTFHQPLL